ncbi:hypothetical protein LTR37_000019 [Vermiconidia calcicola]|uniref:Uncharacterized protein n=1 Tax=Vermiconidia calcicola TaxID=1690605 RepID=A0ACC3NZA5_9PEZI|nr:hypothetical protein LTR37_000019 [Vermiconidia calcicola]
MAQSQKQEATAPRPKTNAPSVHADSLSTQACEADDPAMMEQAISLASQPGSRVTPKKIITDGLKRAARRNSLRVLKYLLDHGADVNDLRAGHLMTTDTCKPPSRELLEMVAAYGWDVNARTGPNGTEYPLLWLVVEDVDLVDVPDPPTVHPDGTTSYSGRPRPTLLGVAASSGTVETFELLRSKGAPLDRRTLHLAVENGHLDMFRHLLEVVGLDVNADGRDPFSMYHSCSTPICITSFRRGSTWRFRGLVFYLLDHGANPELSFGEENDDRWPSAVRCAEMSGNTDFLQAVQEWRARKQGAETLA